ncbi:MAG: cation transporter [Actinomycetota bacterium]|nr:cation transporter [Actinomycetota bacterium]
MVLEAIVAIGAGIAARSVLLTAFGFDSVIELISGGLLLWRLSVEARAASSARVESVEKRAAVISAGLLVLLSIYVLVTSALGLLTRAEPEGSIVGIGVSIAAVIIMPLLARSKRKVNLVVNSAALKADIAETITCAYMAGSVLLGVGLNVALHWWWAEYFAAFALLIWLTPETREALEEARGGADGD